CRSGKAAASTCGGAASPRPRKLANCVATSASWSLMSFDPKTPLDVVASRRRRSAKPEKSVTPQCANQNRGFQKQSSGRRATPVLDRSSQRKLLRQRGVAHTRYERHVDVATVDIGVRRIIEFGGSDHQPRESAKWTASQRYCGRGMRQRRYLWYVWGP